MRLLDYTRLFLTTYLFYLAIIGLLYLFGLRAARPDVLLLLLLITAALSLLPLRAVDRATRRLRYRGDPDAFLDAVDDYAYRAPGFWEIVIDEDRRLRYRYRLRVHNVWLEARIEVLLALDEAVIVGPRRTVQALMTHLAGQGYATAMEAKG